MIKKSYIIFLMLCVLIITGCDANVEIKVDYDGKTTESIDVFDSNDNIVYGNKSIEESINLVLEKYNTALSVGKYKEKVYTGKINSGSIIYRDYDNICEFVNGTIFSQYLYNNIVCNETEKYYEIESIGNVIKNTDFYESWLAPENITLKISLPVMPAQQNADLNEGNTYIWKYNENSSKDKKLYIKIDKKSLNQVKKEYLEVQKRNSWIKKVIIISVFFVIFIMFIVIVIFLYKRHRKNKLDYQ